MPTNLHNLITSRTNVQWIRVILYACFFLSGFTSLVFEVLWSRQFVTVFGNSNYAISIVLCAYMGGLGIGGLYGGRIADRTRHRVILFGIVQGLVAVWAVGIPPILELIRNIVPSISALQNSMLTSTLLRFGLSFAILGVPCFLMGTTLPLLIRTITESKLKIGSRIGMLYSLNTLGAALGCLAGGFWLADTLGLNGMNLTAVLINIVIAIVIVVFIRSSDFTKEPALKEVQSDFQSHQNKVDRPAAPGWLLLSVAFFNGMIGLASEVIWMRYIAFIDNVAYVFPTILCIYLLGIGLGGLVYVFFSGKIRHPVKSLGILEIVLGISIPISFIISAVIFAGGPPRPLELKGMTFITILIPTLLMGMTFPLLCAIYGNRLQTLGRNIGLLYALNTLGTVLGSLLPLFILIPLIGIQKSLFAMAMLSAVIGLLLVAFSERKNIFYTIRLTIVSIIAFILFFAAAPSNLCQRVFMATGFNLAKHTDILFYHEGRTGTSIVARDRMNDCKTIYINGVSEVPVLYSHKLCFKLIGDLAPILHPNPDNVLMICFGGGIAAGATSCLPDVETLTVVDLESSVVESAKLLSSENNQLLKNPKVRVIIDDGRNYLMMGKRKWPVIITDSTHPKSSDSWVLYTSDFYKLVREHLTGDGVFVEWVPMHGLRSEEFKIIVRTFQSVFPHSSLWIAHGIDEQGNYIYYSLLAGTVNPFTVDVAMLKHRLNDEVVYNDLKPYGLHTPEGFLNTFLCAEQTLRSWTGTGPVNTDDLPFTQYETSYSKGVMLEPAEFIEPMEDIWPYLTETGSEEEATRLHKELIIHTNVNRLALLGRVGEAYSLMPEDIRYSHMLKLYQGGPAYIEKLVKLYWDNPKMLVYLASSIPFMPNGDDAVERIYKRVLELDPKNSSALNFLGTQEMNGGNMESAEKYLKHALELSPGFSGARFNLGLVYDKTDRKSEAIKQWKTAAKDPAFEDAANMLGLCLADEGNLTEAVPWFRRANSIKPTSLSIRSNLALALLQTGQIEESKLHVNYILKMDPENEIALNIIALMNGLETDLKK